MPVSGKFPKVAATPEPRRSPTAAPPNYNSEHPSWRISKIEMVNPFGWQEIGRAALEDVRAKLSNFESMTWNQILVEARKQNHSIPVWDLCQEAQARLETIGLEDTEEVISLRLSGKERVWGIRQGAALLVLWWDPDHRVCPSVLKYT